MKLVGPSYDAYLAKAGDLHEEFGDLVIKHGSKILGCDEKCLSDCMNPHFVSFWEIPSCVKHCKCEYGMIRIEQ